ncbi:hypothetical protein LCGC14_2410120 [marine sediment metagenome]|uniref:Uncharacterized protein n=1 Tax=marine sediment metagenome TaxID=412755 RepID=A0A0F9CEW2_9ZZZZ
MMGKKIYKFSDEQKEMIESALMANENEGVYNTKKSKELYEEIWDELEGKL